MQPSLARRRMLTLAVHPDEIRSPRRAPAISGHNDSHCIIPQRAACSRRATLASPHTTVAPHWRTGCRELSATWPTFFHSYDISSPMQRDGRLRCNSRQVGYRSTVAQPGRRPPATIASTQHVRLSMAFRSLLGGLGQATRGDKRSVPLRLDAETAGSSEIGRVDVFFRKNIAMPYPLPRRSSSKANTTHTR
jgi:hypothetical protein